ncbi:glycerophosphodiester phosphodiesterase family protein [Parvularcula sp. ZS-1/3]|uniref:Glycerophosphodiester phosphodiesterase family protein n=1 Tax=Parvularcula mediterranea TaxID=2732508 RepID=A0A7Y3RK26_9PROT|nr:glycerophosphodiester phosphodiesterase family protein [Parvularcula mediterranea]NNU15524.1 glycerophosphodiester phosphodiesterase family protein [Parvularcula mediterranea]
MTLKSLAGAAAALSLIGCAEDAGNGEPTAPITTDVTAAAFLSCLEGKEAIVSAHRGGPAPGFPENAIETFERTLSRVPALIETDVRETSDGVLVLLHDETVDRTSDGSGDISDLTLEEVKALRLKDKDGRLTEFRIPTLDEALDAMRGKTILQLDVKRGVSLRKVARAVVAKGAEGHAAIITYSDNGAIIAAQASPLLSVIASVDNSAHLADLERRGLPKGRLVAWTGLIENPNAALYRVLGEKDVSTSGGAIGRLDRRAAAGERGLYAGLEDAGLDVIATDRPVEAAREIGASQTAAAIRSCASS